MMKLEEMMQDTDRVASHEVDPRLLEVLVCPLTRGPLVYDRANSELISHQARKAYPGACRCADHAWRRGP